jgi:hypothetical protein
MSTVVWGINPQTYPRRGFSLYNGGIVGSSMEEQYYYVLRYLQQCPNISRVYLDLNGEAFQDRAPQRDFVPDRLTTAIYPPDLLFTTFSSSAIFAAARTIYNAWTQRIQQMLSDNGDGFHFRPNMGRDEDHYNAIVGFLNLDDSRRVVRVSELQMSYFEQLVHELNQRNIELIAFFGPISQFLFAQAEAREVHTVRPGENMYFDLRRRIAAITDFWDFGLNNAITGEDIAKTKYFFDQIHYFPELGTLALAAINGIGDQSLPKNFVVHVTSTTIDAHIAALRQGNEHWRTKYPMYWQMITDHYAKVKVNDNVPADLF